MDAELRVHVLEMPLHRASTHRQETLDLDSRTREGALVTKGQMRLERNAYAKTLTSRYSVSRWTGVFPSERMR